MLSTTRLRLSTLAQPLVSYTELGTQYELRTIEVLKKYAFELRHTGGRSDGGIDLVGNWLIPGIPKIPIIVQCKNITSKLGPVMVREVEGVIAGRQGGTLGILVCSQSASDASRQRIELSNWPFIYCHILFEAAEHPIQTIIISEGLRLKYPGISIACKMNIDHSSGEQTERFLFAFNGKPLVQ